MSATTTIPVPVPGDVSSLTEMCRVKEGGTRCPRRAAWRVLGECPSCHFTGAYPVCGHHKAEALANRQTTACCRIPVLVIAVEVL